MIVPKKQKTQNVHTLVTIIYYNINNQLSVLLIFIYLPNWAEVAILLPVPFVWDLMLPKGDAL